MAFIKKGIWTELSYMRPSITTTTTTAAATTTTKPLNTYNSKKGQLHDTYMLMKNSNRNFFKKNDSPTHIQLQQQNNQAL